MVYSGSCRPLGRPPPSPLKSASASKNVMLRGSKSRTRGFCAGREPAISGVAVAPSNLYPDALPDKVPIDYVLAPALPEPPGLGRSRTLWRAFCPL